VLLWTVGSSTYLQVISKKLKEELMKLTNVKYFTQHIDRLLYGQELLESYFITNEEESKRNISDTMHKTLAIKEELANTLSITERNAVLMEYFMEEFETTTNTHYHTLRLGPSKVTHKSKHEHSNSDFTVLVGKLGAVAESTKKYFEKARDKVATTWDWLEVSKAQLSEMDNLFNQHLKRKDSIPLDADDDSRENFVSRASCGILVKYAPNLPWQAMVL